MDNNSSASAPAAGNEHPPPSPRDPLQQASSSGEESARGERKESPLHFNYKLISTIVMVVVISLLIAAALFAWRRGLFSSAETLYNYLKQLGIWGPVAFLTLQVLQIVVPLIPGGITCTVSVMLFGPVYGFMYNYLGILMGSFLVFFLARRYGLPLIQSMVKPQTFSKYIVWLDKEQSLFNKLFSVAIFLPFAPDDLLCMLAGISKMKVKTFTWILLLLKIPFLLPYSFGVNAIMQWLGIAQ